MTEEKKTKSGAGKFFLGAALGAIAGAVASKFISVNKPNECGCEESCPCHGECNETCGCAENCTCECCKCSKGCEVATADSKKETKKTEDKKSSESRKSDNK